MLTGEETRDARMTTSSVNMTTLWMVSVGIAALLATVICADGSTSLQPSTAASVPLTPASGNNMTQTTTGDASYVVSSLVVVAFGAIFGWFF